MAFICKDCKKYFIHNVTQDMIDDGFCSNCYSKKINPPKQQKSTNTYKSCPNCKSTFFSESCQTCDYNSTTGARIKCPNCGTTRTKKFCMCGYDFVWEKMFVNEVEFYKFEVKYFNAYKISQYDKVEVRRTNNHPYPYNFELKCKGVLIGELSRKTNVDNKTCIVKSNVDKIIIIAVSELPYPLLVEHVKKNNIEEAKVAKDKAQLLKQQVISIGYRENWCHTCHSKLSTQTHFICNSCKWIKCHCGACGCNYNASSNLNKLW